MGQDLSILFSMKSLIIFLLVLSRITGTLMTAPLFSTSPIPSQLKGALAALIAFIMYPYILQHSQIAVPYDLITMTLLVMKEVLVGVLIGFCASLIFVGIQIGGQLVSTQMGLTIAESLDPVTHQNVPILGQFYLYIASMVFIYMNGHQWIFENVFTSYKTLPMGLDFSFTPKLTEQIIYFISQLFPIAFSVIMPIFAILFVLDIALGFMSKMMPQMNIFMVSLPLKIYIGMACMVIFMHSTAVYMSSMTQSMLDSLKTIFGG